VQFHFNAWAKYDDWQKDRRVPETAARRLGKRLFDAPIILEGGGIEVNGRGTLITTEECYLDPKIQVRNPGLGRAEFEAALRECLGVRNICWLSRGPAGDDTHGHIDDICRFVNARTLVLIREDNPADINYRPLGKTGNASRTCVWKTAPSQRWWRCPCPRRSFSAAAACRPATPISTSERRGPGPHVQRSQRPRGAGILGELFRDRPVVGIHCVDMILGFGSLHCLSQQVEQPAE
jgi:agmatine deiminase